MPTRRNIEIDILLGKAVMQKNNPKRLWIINLIISSQQQQDQILKLT